jgi:branched-chain amino acid transport system ATP-binding protein
MSTPLVETKGVSKHYGEFRALDDVTVSVAEGEFVSIVGPNGAGKTTLVNLLTGLLVPTKGEVRFKGSNIAGVGPVKLAERGMARAFPARADFPAAHRRRDHRRRRGYAPGQAVAAVLEPVRR